MGKHIEFGAVHQSIRDLVRINKIKPNEVPSFIRSFIRKYDLPRFFVSELEEVALKELAKEGDQNEGA